MAKTPELGGELPAYKTQGSVPRQQGFPDKPKAPRKMVAPPAYLTSKTVVRSPKVSLGTPGTKNYVQRMPAANLGTPGTKNYVPRVSNNMRPRKPGAGGMERFMSAMGSVLRTKMRKPTK